MNLHPRTRRLPALALALVLVATLAPARPASAQGSTDVTVTASVNETLSLTLCDTTANFGAGLNNQGAAPSLGSTNDLIEATDQGTNPGEGVFYNWTPSCQAAGTGHFIRIESNIEWHLSACASENTGSNPDLSRVDLHWSSETRVSYAGALATSVFLPCPGENVLLFSGNASVPNYYLLRIDDHVGAGTFEVITTWAVTPA